MQILGWRAKKPAPEAEALPEPTLAPMPELMPELMPASTPGEMPAPAQPPVHIVFPIYDVDGIIVGLSTEGVQVRSALTKAEVHAAALLTAYGKSGYYAGRWITGVQMQALCRGLIAATGEPAQPWEKVAAELRRQAGAGKRSRRIGKKRHPLFFIPDLRAS